MYTCVCIILFYIYSRSPVDSIVMWFANKTVLADNAIFFNSINPVEHLAFGFLGTENNIKAANQWCETFELNYNAYR
jgi:hypothetical protein